MNMCTCDNQQNGGTKKDFWQNLWDKVNSLIASLIKICWRIVSLPLTLLKTICCEILRPPITCLNGLLSKALGWEEPNKKKADEEKTDKEELPDLQWEQWKQWEEVWCEKLCWKPDKLREFGERCKNVKQEKLKDELKKIRGGGTKGSNREVALLLLYSVFRTNYSTALKKKQKNNELNFLCKRRFIYLIFYTIIGHILLAVLFFFLYLNGFSGKQLLSIEGFVLFVPVVFAIIIGKDLDIHKYQETWSRHTKYQYLRNQEMLRFMLDLEPYVNGEDEKNVDRFATAILEIEGLNIVKFCENMDTKEKGLLDEALSLIQKKKG